MGQLKRKVAGELSKRPKVQGWLTCRADKDTWSQVKPERVKKETTYGELKRKLAEELGVDPARQRFWTFAKRQNSTVRCVLSLAAKGWDSTSKLACPSESDMLCRLMLRHDSSGTLHAGQRGP